MARLTGQAALDYISQNPQAGYKITGGSLPQGYQPPQPQKQGGNFLTNLIGGLTEAPISFLQAGAEAPLSALGALIDPTKDYDPTFMSKDEFRKIENDPFFEVGKSTAGTMAYMVPGGGSFGGGLSGVAKAGALSGGLTGASQADTRQDLLSSTLTGSVTGAGTAGALHGAGKALKGGQFKLPGVKKGKLGDVLTKKGELQEYSYYTRSLGGGKAGGGRPNTFEGGMDLFRDMKKQGIIQKLNDSPEVVLSRADDIISKKGPLVNNQIQKLSQQGKTVNISNIRESLTKKMGKAVGSKEKKMYGGMIDELNVVSGGVDDMPIDRFYQLKQEIGDQAFTKNLTQKGTTRTGELRKVYGLMNESMDDTLKSTGFKDFRKINSQYDAAKRAQRYITRRGEATSVAKPFNVFDLGTGLGGFALTGNPLGAVAAYGGKKALTSPAAERAYIKMLQGLGSKTAGKGINLPQSQVLQNLLTKPGMQQAGNMGMRIAPIAAAQQMTGAPAGGEMPQDPASMLMGGMPGMSGDQGMGMPQMGLTGGQFGMGGSGMPGMGGGPQQQQMLALSLLSSGMSPTDAKTTLDLLGMSGGGGMESPYAGMSSTQQQSMADAQSAIQMLDTLEGSLASKSGTMGPLMGRLRGINPLDVDYQNQQQLINTSKQVIGKYLEGGVLRKEDEEKYAKILPTMNDNAEVAQVKINNLKALLNQKFNTQQNIYSGGNTGIGMSPEQMLMSGSQLY